jgi:phage terminase large subunit-like protein
MDLQTSTPKKGRKPLELGGMDGADYARGVLTGKILVSPLTTKAFERHRADLARQKDPEFPFVFQPEHGAKVLRFLELHVHVQGDLAGKSFRPEPWQRAATSILYGWRVKGDEKRRRFRRASIFVPRGNGKTYWGAGLCDYHAFADGEGGAAVYSFAVTKEQARLSWTAAQSMLRHEKMLKTRLGLGIQVGQHSISKTSSNSFFKALASEHDSLDGLNVSFGLGDEVASHPSRALFDVIATATAKRSTSLLLTISTASGNTGSIGKELWDHGVKVMNGTIEDESFFFLAYECPPDLIDVALTSEKAWKAANPNWGVSVQPDVFAQLMENSRQNPSARAAVLTKLLNVWVSADAAYYDLEDFDACVDRTTDRATLESFPAYAGLDLASKLDLACAAYVVPVDRDGVTHYFAWVDSFLNEDAAADSRNVNYQRWAENGALTVTPGGVTDYATIEASILETGLRVVMQSVSFDAWQGQYFSQRLEAAGLVPVETRMTTAFLSTPMKELGSLMRQRRIHFIGPPDVLRFCVGNVVSKDDVRGNPYPRKERPESKIDAVTALLLALGRALVAPPMSDSEFYVVG